MRNTTNTLIRVSSLSLALIGALALTQPAHALGGALGAVLAMGAGLLTTVGYMAWTSPTVRRAMGWAGDGLWWGIQPVASGVFGAAAGVSALVLAALILRPESGIAEPHAGPRTEDSLGL